MRITFIVSVFVGLFFFSSVKAQPVPGVDENIPFLITFGSGSETAWGDDDFLQIIFFAVPEDF